MGSSSSKAARTAAGSAARKYPSRPPTSRPPPPPRPKPTPASQAQASASKSEVIDLDGRDPQFASRLAELGPVKPAPTYSPSDRSAQTQPSGPQDSEAASAHTARAFANNPAIVTVTARKRIQDEAEQEKIDVGRKGFPGRQYVDIATVRKVLAYRDEKGMKDEDIERALGLRKGVVAGLGPVGVVEVA